MNHKPTKVINIKDKFSLFNEHWTPKVIAEMNDLQFKIAKVSGEFVWHHHDESDETFIVIHGELSIELENETLHLKAGEMTVIPKGVKHRPVAKQEAHLLVLESKGIINTGDIRNEKTAPNDVWI